MSDIADKISALLAKAERTDNDYERDAFTEKAQNLATTYAIDLEVARQRQRNKEKREVPEVRTINIGPSGKKNLRHFVSLFLAIGGAQDVIFDIARNSTFVIAYGYPADIEVTERLYASLSVQMQRAADAAISAGEHKKEENAYYQEERFDYNRCVWVGGKMRTDGRAFRTAFYEGFVGRVKKRLLEARKQAEAAYVAPLSASVAVADQPTTGALVLVGKRETVRAFHKEKTTARGAWKGSASSGSSAGGFRSGAAAGDRANLHGTQNALPGSRKQVTS